MMYFRQLKNSLRIGVAPIPGDKTVTAILSFHVGSKYDPEFKKGTAHFIEHMLFKGTKNRPELTQVERDIERLGGYFNAYTVKEFTWFYIKILRKDLEMALDVLQDIVSNSLFLPKEFEKEKQVIIEEINIYNDSPAELIKDLFEKCLYYNQPISHSVLGTAETIKKIKNSDLTDFFKKFYTASNTVLTVAGGIDPQKTLKLCERYFSNLSGKTKSAQIKEKDKQTSPQMLVQYKKIDQSQIALGVRTFQLVHKDHYHAKLIAILLGGNMSARLFKRMREELALVYDVLTMSESRPSTGYLTTYTGLQKDNIPKVLKEILGEYKRLKYEAVDNNELDDAKRFLLNKKKILCENSDFVALDLAKRILFKKRAITFEQYQKQIEKITPEDIVRVADKIFSDDNLNLAIIGQVNKKDENEYKRLLTFS